MERLSSCRSIFVHESVAPRALPKRPQNQFSTAGLIQWLRRKGCPKGRSLDLPQPGGRSGCAGQRTRRRCLAGVKAGRCDASALRDPRLPGLHPHSGLLRRIYLPPLGVKRLRSSCTLFSCLSSSEFCICHFQEWVIA